MSSIVTRFGEETDLPALTDIYNHYIEASAVTFDIELVSVEERREWFDHYSPSGPHRLVVADRGGEILGYASSGPLRPKPAYLTSVEVSVYLAPESTGQGLGSLLYTALFESLRGEDVFRAYAGVTIPNDASVALHKRFGFEMVGQWNQVGRKAGQYWSVQWYEKQLG